MNYPKQPLPPIPGKYTIEDSATIISRPPTADTYETLKYTASRDRTYQDLVPGKPQPGIATGKIAAIVIGVIAVLVVAGAIAGGIVYATTKDKETNSWNHWNSWSSCSTTCGDGVQIRTRTCSSESLSVCGAGENQESQQCNVANCLPSSGASWLQWGSWSVCSKTCGNGIITRTRTCATSNGVVSNSCNGNAHENAECNLQNCPTASSVATTAGNLVTNEGNGETTGASIGNGSNTQANGISTVTTQTTPSTVDPGWTDWSLWSACTTICGPGLQIRNRFCIMNAGCIGVSSEQKTCNRISCDLVLTLVNGKWSGWRSWSSCTKSCGGGLQERTRTCTEPAPANGGDQCAGNDTEIRKCADWPCPDCSRTCQNGGTLKNCMYCSCIGVYLYGTVFNVAGAPLPNVSIYHENDQNTALATTDEDGKYTITDICSKDQTFYVKKAKFNDESLVPNEVNISHWKLDATLIHQVKPMVTLSPESKTRFEGQSLVFCCNATGSPEPERYEWYKDNILLIGKDSVDGRLELDNLTAYDNGQYMCRAINDAGAANSLISKLTITENNRTDTCAIPEEKLEILPSGCNTLINGMNYSSVNVGYCSPVKCINHQFVDQRNCSDNYKMCCGANTTKAQTISCENFSYTLTVITGCSCQSCSGRLVATTVSGRAYGFNDNGDSINMKLGAIYYGNKLLVRTSFSGGFSFDVPENVTNLVLYFEDDIFKIFAPSIQHVDFIVGESIFVDIILPVKPTPIYANASSDIKILIVANKATLATNQGRKKRQISGSSFDIPKNSLKYPNGTIFTDQAVIEMKCYDPKNLNDIKSAPVPFITLNSEGDKTPLQTFSFCMNSFSDNNGNGLVLERMQWNLDVSQMDIPVDDGSPDAQFYYVNPYTGYWEEVADFTLPSAPSGRKKRQSSLNMITSNVELPNLNELPLTTFETVWRTRTQYYWNYNGDRRLMRYSRTSSIVERRRDDLCFVRVGVYTDPAVQAPLTPSGSIRPQVHVITKHRSSNEYFGVQRSFVNPKGFACVPTYCNQTSFVYVQVGAENISYVDHLLPSGYSVSDEQVTNRYSDPYITFTNDISPVINGRTGPIYFDTSLAVCEAASGNDYHFRFAPLVQPDTLNSLSQGMSIADAAATDWYSWNAMNRADACFIKIKIVHTGYNLQLVGESSNSNDRNQVYGVFTTNPRAGTAGGSNKAACVQFKCAGNVWQRTNNGVEEIPNVPTEVDIRMSPQSTACVLTRTNTDFANSVDYMTQNNRLNFTAEPTNNYGSQFGIYKDFVRNGEEANNLLRARHKCFTGTDSGTSSDIMVTDVGWALEYTCS